MWQGDYDTYLEAIDTPTSYSFGLLGISFMPGTVTTGSVIPRANNLLICGSNDMAWSAVYTYNLIDKCNIYDDLDAISVLKNIKEQHNKNNKLDHSTLPDFLREGEDGRNLGKYVDVIASAIKQLDKRLLKLEK
jgi:hypothetical protein